MRFVRVERGDRSSRAYRINAGFLPRDHWTQDLREGGGRLLGEGVHFIDWITWFVGTAPVGVHATAMGDAGRYQRDNLAITLSFANGSIGQILYVANAERAFGKERIEVHGGGRSALLEDYRLLEFEGGPPHGGEEPAPAAQGASRGVAGVCRRGAAGRRESGADRRGGRGHARRPLWSLRVHVFHVVGARPNFMKAAPVIAALARRGMSQTLVHTGQHYDTRMSDVFFHQLGLPEPDVNLEVGSGSHAAQAAQIMMRLEPVLLEQRPDWVLVYGDVNSTVAAALVCAKLPLPLAHVEAGLRSGDRVKIVVANGLKSCHRRL